MGQPLLYTPNGETRPVRHIKATLEVEATTRPWDWRQRTSPPAGLLTPTGVCSLSKTCECQAWAQRRPLPVTMPPLGVTVCPRHCSLFLRKVSRGLCGVAGRTRAASGDRDPRNLLSKQPAAEPWPRPLPASRLQPLSCGCQDRLPQRLWGGFPIKALGSGGPLCSSDSRHPSASHLEHVDPGGPLGSSTHSFPGTRSLRDLLSSLLGRLTTLRFAIVSPETVTMHVNVVGDFELGRGKERPRVHLGAY